MIAIATRSQVLLTILLPILVIIGIIVGVIAIVVLVKINRISNHLNTTTMMIGQLANIPMTIISKIIEKIG